MTALDANQIGLLFHGQIWLDLTETTSSFHRTGIQRTLAQMIATATDRGRLVPFTVAPDGAVIVHDHALLDLLADELFSADDFEEVSAKIAKVTSHPLCRVDRDALLAARAVVNIEVFFNPVRAEFYDYLLKKMRERIFFLIYDIIPIGQPNYFKHHLPFAMEYFRFCLSVENIATISSFTRDQMVTVLGRNDTHNIRVITLGTDTFGSAPPAQQARDLSGTPLFVVVGTVMDCKGHLLVLQTFRALWDAGIDVSLMFLGDADGDASDELFEAMEESGQNPAQFRWFQAPGDRDIRDTLAAAWGTVYVSDGEGFGLGPLESLQAGVPTIVRSDYPSLADVPPLGQIRVPPSDEQALKAAVLSLLDRNVHRTAKADLAKLTLKTWPQFGRDLNGWIESRASRAQPIDDLGFGTVAAGGLRSKSLRLCRDLLFGNANAFAKASANLKLDIESWYNPDRLRRLIDSNAATRPLLVADLVHHSVGMGSCDRETGLRTLLTCMVLVSGQAGAVDHGHHKQVPAAPASQSAAMPELDRLPEAIDRLNGLDALPPGDFATALARFLVGDGMDLAVWHDLCLLVGSFSSTRRQTLVKWLFTCPVGLESNWDRWIVQYCAASVVLANPDWGRAPVVCNDVLLLSSVPPPLLRNLSPAHSDSEQRLADALALPETVSAAQFFETLTGRKLTDEQIAFTRNLLDIGASREALLAFIGTLWAGLPPDALDTLRLTAAKAVLTGLMAASRTDNPEAFIRRCYANILFRRSDEAGFAHSMQDYRQGSPFRIIENLMRSQEAMSFYGAMAAAVANANPPHGASPESLLESVKQLLEVPNGQLCALLYKTLLGRTASTDEANLASTQLAFGVSRERMIAAMLASTEFRGRILDPDEPAIILRLLGTRLLGRCRDALRMLDGEGFVDACFLLLRGRPPSSDEKTNLSVSGVAGRWRELLRTTLASDECSRIFTAQGIDEIRPMLADRLISRPPLTQRVTALLNMGEGDFVACVTETLSGKWAEPVNRHTMAYRLSLGMPRESVIFQTLGRLVPTTGGEPNMTFVELVDAVALAVARRLYQASTNAANPESYVNACYLAILGRPADLEGLNSHAEIMRNEPGVGWLRVAQHLVKSPECTGCTGLFAQSRMYLVIVTLLREPERAASLLGASALQASLPASA
ncbi:glycosyltransferase (plasmid) [Azospirillum sp. HJ39]|uniref:DUF4214 domain-containing protein n=1 Tax=Azospirillum sp. HJ39 TaxID=3159496 RepID=UPI003557629B